MIARSDDGYDLWYEAFGHGPAIVFPSRLPTEHVVLARALADQFRVVLYEPRWYSLAAAQVGGGDFSELLVTSIAELIEAQEQLMSCYERGVSGRGVAGADVGELAVALALRPKMHPSSRDATWEDANWEEFPFEQDVADLHLVADAAGVSTMSIAGYSGTGAYAAMLAPYSSRITGLVVGGFPLLDPYDYWLGFREGRRDMARALGDMTEMMSESLWALMFDLMNKRDEAAAYGRISGPKVLWFGANDSEFGWFADALRGARIAQRIRSRRAELEELGFEVIELPSRTHATAAAAIDEAVSLFERTVK